MCNEEEEENMISAPVKPIKPMDIEFKNECEREKFINWADSKEKDNSENMERMRREFKQIRGMRKKGF